MKQLKLFSVLLSVLLISSCGGDDSTRKIQTITFNLLSPRNLSESSVKLDATASSGLQVIYANSDTSVASISDGTVALHKRGLVTITATQPGNESYFEAPAVKRDLVINEDNNPDKQNQSITFELSETSLNYSTKILALEATATSGLPVTFSSNHRFVRITGDILELLYEGVHYDDDATIVASQAGNDEYNAAPNVSKRLHVVHNEK
jgi:hypothetical protein